MEMERFLNWNKSKLFKIYIQNYGLLGDLSEHVYSDFDQLNILSPHDTHSTLLKIKTVVKRQEKGIEEEVILIITNI